MAGGLVHLLDLLDAGVLVLLHLQRPGGSQQRLPAQKRRSVGASDECWEF